jgi:hypothetical protein
MVRHTTSMHNHSHGTYETKRDHARKTFIYTEHQNLLNSLVAALLFATRRTLNRTVFDSGRHCPAKNVKVNGTALYVDRFIKLTNGYKVPNLNTECWRYMCCQVPVSLLVTVYVEKTYIDTRHIRKTVENHALYFGM